MSEKEVVNKIALIIEEHHEWDGALHVDDLAKRAFNTAHQHFVEQACAAITDNPHKNPIEAITDMVRKETD